MNNVSRFILVLNRLGRLISDANKGITSIKYNVLGLPAEVTFSDGSSITSRYGADGALLQRVKEEPIQTVTPLALPAPVIKPATTKTADSHIGSLTIRTTTSKSNASVTSLSRVDTPTGYIADGRMHYYVKDYQGNVRQVTDADGNVEQDNHYYPYGMLMGESSDILATARGGSVTNPNPYLYGSKEYLTTAGANLLDFTARTYDPSLPLFQTQDPIAGDYKQFNTYLYCGADPINYIDPTGCNPIYNTFGELIAVTDTGLEGTPYIIDTTNMEKEEYRHMTDEELQKINLGVSGLAGQDAIS